MAGGVAHDFNNVLAVASGTTEMLAGELGARGVLDKDSQDLIEALQQALAQGAGLTRRLLQFSRQRQGQPRDVEVFEALRAATPLLRQILGHAITLELRGSTGLPPIHIDPVDLEQVMLNLVVNARDAMASDGKLTIEVGSFEATEDDGGPDGLAPGRWVRVFVRDTGCGMSAEVRKRIFEPFFTTKSADRGTGLGLSTVFAIVHGQGGRIAVATRPGEGTEFRLYFPASSGH